MVMRLVVSIVLALFCIVAISNHACTDDSFGESLFDGKTLQGWEGDPNYWRVESHAIVGEIPPGKTLSKNTWIVWRGGELKDFDLRLQVKLTGAAAANSGIQYRCQVKNVGHVSGYQADLDMGAVWLGRIYDEHGRGLLVERGARLLIDQNGKRHAQTFSPAGQFAVLFRENAWNDYRIVAIGEHMAVFVNGTLFSELLDRQQSQRDLSGALAFQLHSGPTTRVEFRDIRMERLRPNDRRLGDFPLKKNEAEAISGVSPKDEGGNSLNLSFETGDLGGWKATGNAFRGQPVSEDGIANRWPGQTSRKHGKYFMGGWEVVEDKGTGTLASQAFKVTHPYASFLIAGGNTRQTRVEVIQPANGNAREKVIFSAIGNRREQMRRVAVDLRPLRGQAIAVRLVDESTGPWGHLNFDDFRFHDKLPDAVESKSPLSNPVLRHLVPNPVSDQTKRGTETVSRMFVPKGFSVDVIAAEPELHQPMAFTFDAKGRLWVVEGHSYPQKRPEGKGLDRILIFSDDNGDGSFEKRKVFIEGLNLVSGLQVGHGGVWVGAAPELLFIPDKDGDDRPDARPTVLLDGFGYQDTHETPNSFTWGPDGWLYSNQGVFNTSMIGKPGSAKAKRTQLNAGVWRYHPTRHVFEVFAYGGSNPWGLDFDTNGQLFITHCRSFWAKGATTHIIQGGHYWNQVNRGYASFISSRALPGMPAMKNYLLASARYGHGEGGAGKRGSRAVYGGHSHVGTMIYLGDNWPARYRNHLFTHNLHGHQMNHQVNRREGGGYNTVHAGYDMLYCADRQYIGVDLQYGPDGAVYISDWYDPRHCHNPAIEQWDRGNGRMYRMKFDATWRPVTIDYSKATDNQLVDAQLHTNDWHVRMSRLVLAERAATGTISNNAINRLVSIATKHGDAPRRLRAVWALHGAGEINHDVVAQLLEDKSEYVRAWAVQLAVESLSDEQISTIVTQLVKREESLFVRRYLASAIQRVPNDVGWKLGESLANQAINATDRELPMLLWFGIAKLMKNDLPRSLKLADTTVIPSLRDYVHWYATQLSNEGREAVAERMARASDKERLRLLLLFESGISGMRGLAEPKAWSTMAPKLYKSRDGATRRAAEALGAAFGHSALYQQMRQVLANESSSIRAKQHALSILAKDTSGENLPYLLKLLDTNELVAQIVPMLKRFNQPSVATELIVRMPKWSTRANALAMDALSSRANWAGSLLEAIAAGKIDKSQLSAFYARQMSNLGNDDLNKRLTKQWGRLGGSSAERNSEIAKTVKAYTEAPLWAYNAGAGKTHFEKLCASCHQPVQDKDRFAPRLAGSGSKGIAYIVENIVDPNAVVGNDFQARIVSTFDGQVITGMIIKETNSAVVVRTATSTETILKDDIDEVKVSTNSLMPEGLLKSLNDRQRIELLKFLMSLK